MNEPIQSWDSLRKAMKALSFKPLKYKTVKVSKEEEPYYDIEMGFDLSKDMNRETDSKDDFQFKL